MPDTLKDLCIQLDELLLEVLELTEEHINYKLTLEESMKPGFVHIAKSRYIMGNKTVSALQLPTEDTAEFEALATVNCLESTSTNNFTELSLHNVDLTDCNESAENGILRKRKDKPREVNLCETSKDKSKCIYVNPLNWFGVLVPQNLRMAQHCFKTTLPLVVECVNIQNRLLKVQQEFKRLLGKKNTFLQH